MRVECPECERETVGGLTATEDVVCQTCGAGISAGDVTTDDEALTAREWDALGKQGDAPDSEPEADTDDE